LKFNEYFLTSQVNAAGNIYISFWTQNAHHLPAQFKPMASLVN